MTENEFKFEKVDMSEIGDISSLFPRPGKPLGEVFLIPNGCLITEHYTKSAKIISEMDVRPDDLWIVSFPRSGITKFYD